MVLEWRYSMDQDDQKVADLLENQDIVDRKFADRVAMRFDEIGTTPNWLTAWRIILSIPVFLCFIVANIYQDTEHDNVYWFWGTFGTSALYMIYEIRNFYLRRDMILVTRWRLLILLPFVLFTGFTIYSLERDALIWLCCMTIGGLTCIWALLLDFFDGALARYQDDVDKIPIDQRPRISETEEYNLPLSKRLNLRGSSHYGGTIDPFSDKTLNLGSIGTLGWFVVSRTYLWLSILVALILTLIRFRAIRRMLEFGGKGSANRFGKYKILIEVACIIILALFPTGPIKELIANVFIGIALTFGCLSLVGHTWLGLKKAKAIALRKVMSSHRK